MIRDLARVNDARNEFVAVAAHDLQTPLGVMSGWLTMASERLRAGTIDRSRTVEFMTDGADVVTHIEDSGQGFSDEDLQRVFRTFKRLSARPIGGYSAARSQLVCASMKREH